MLVTFLFGLGVTAADAAAVDGQIVPDFQTFGLHNKRKRNCIHWVPSDRVALPHRGTALTLNSEEMSGTGLRAGEGVPTALSGFLSVLALCS